MVVRLHTLHNTTDKMSKRIKDTYQKHLWIFFSANITIYIIVTIYGYFSINNANIEFSKFINPKSILFILSPLISLIINGLFPNSFKEFLVFWKIKNRLPGCRAFSEFALEDPRIDVEILKKKIGEFPYKPIEQNKLWYTLYKQLRENEIIIGSHRDFLLTRDLCTISFALMILLIPLEIFYCQNTIAKIAYSIFLFLQFLVLSISSRNYGNRFVCNVLAETAR